MWQQALLFLAGAAVAPALRAALKGSGRPITREVIRFGILAGDKIQQFHNELKEDVEDLTAEARAEIKRGPTD